MMNEDHSTNQMEKRWDDPIWYLVQLSEVLSTVVPALSHRNQVVLL